MSETEKYRKALAEVARCRGPFSRDHMEHAQNTILAMANTARMGLGLPEVDSIEKCQDGLPPEVDE